MPHQRNSLPSSSTNASSGVIKRRRKQRAISSLKIWSSIRIVPCNWIRLTMSSGQFEGSSGRKPWQILRINEILPCSRAKIRFHTHAFCTRATSSLPWHHLTWCPPVFLISQVSSVETQDQTWTTEHRWDLKFQVVWMRSTRKQSHTRISTSSTDTKISKLNLYIIRTITLDEKIWGFKSRCSMLRCVEHIAFAVCTIQFRSVRKARFECTCVQCTISIVYGRLECTKNLKVEFRHLSDKIFSRFVLEHYRTLHYVLHIPTHHHYSSSWSRPSVPYSPFLTTIIIIYLPHHDVWRYTLVAPIKISWTLQSQNSITKNRSFTSFLQIP